MTRKYRYKAVVVDQEALYILATYKYRFGVRSFAETIKIMHKLIETCKCEEAKQEQVSTPSPI